MVPRTLDRTAPRDAHQAAPATRAAPVVPVVEPGPHEATGSARAESAGSADQVAGASLVSETIVTETAIGTTVVGETVVAETVVSETIVSGTLGAEIGTEAMAVVAPLAQRRSPSHRWLPTRRRRP